MSGLPKMLRRTPQFFYAAGGIFFVWYLGNTYVELVTTVQATDGLEGIAGLLKSKALFEASLQAVYMISSGAMIQVLIAIYDKLAGEVS